MAEKPGNDEARERLELAAKLAERVQIIDVILTETKALRTPGPRNDLRDASIETDVSTVCSASDDSKVLAVMAKFQLHASRPDGAKDRFLSIEAEFVLIYTVSSTEGLTQKHFEAFADANGVFNAWPYWREYVHSMAQRMGLDALIVPVFRITGKKPKTATVAANAVETAAEVPALPDKKTPRKGRKAPGLE